MAEESKLEIKESNQRIFFSEISPRYPEITEDGKIDTVQFLEASRSSIHIYDLLGTAFYVVKKDMLGNVDKLTKVFNKAPEKYKYINDLIYMEKDDPSNFAVDALLWLKRALEFTSSSLRKMVLDWQSDHPSDTVTQLVGAAYEDVLKRHHNWLIQNVFKVVLRAFPSRKDMIRIFYFGEDGPLEDLLEAANVYLNELDSNLEVVIKLFAELDIDPCKERS